MKVACCNSIAHWGKPFTTDKHQIYTITQLLCHIDFLTLNKIQLRIVYLNKNKSHNDSHNVL